MATIKAICISNIRGIQKHEIPEAELRAGFGIVGDAHAGNWHRQVSLLSTSSVDELQSKLDFELKNGDFAENILVDGIYVHTLPIGTKLQIGEAICEITQIGKECHKDCAIRKAAGDCVMPREGVFVKVLSSRKIKKNDEIKLVEAKC